MYKYIGVLSIGIVDTSLEGGLMLRLLSRLWMSMDKYWFGTTCETLLVGVDVGRDGPSGRAPWSVVGLQGCRSSNKFCNRLGLSWYRV